MNVLDALDQEIRAFVDAEVEVAQASPLPEPHVALESVYADPPLQTDHMAPYREGADA